jgi:hypothetical protein
MVFAIENRTGAGGIIGAEASRRHRSARSADEQAICNLVDAPTVIIVNSASPFKPVDLIEAARARPPKRKAPQMRSAGPGFSGLGMSGQVRKSHPFRASAIQLCPLARR